jgi:uncharacterized protein
MMMASSQINQIVERVVQRLEPEKIILFGSHATGNPREDSDVDLLVVAETDLPVKDRYPVIRRLLMDFPTAFDLFWKTPEEYDRLRTVVNHIVYFAEKYGKVVYERQHAGIGEAVVR